MRPADHQILVDSGAVEAELDTRLDISGQVGDGEGVGVPERDVAGGILVEQEVVEDAAVTADRGGARGEGGLPPARGPFLGGGGGGNRTPNPILAYADSP